MAKLYNLAGMSTSTTGTGTITLGSAMYGHLTFAQAGIVDGDTVTYAIKDGDASEIGRGVYTASGTTLTRGVTKSTNSDAAIDLSGTAEVFITASAEDFYPVVNAQTGTSYTLLGSDSSKLVTVANASAVAVTIPQATGVFAAGFYCYLANVGASVVTVTPTTSTIAGAASLVLYARQAITLISDGVNWQAIGHPRGLRGATTSAGDGYGGGSIAIGSYSYTGGTPGVVNSVSHASATVSSGVADYVWAGLDLLSNGATAGENVARYSQAIKTSTGPTWGMVAEVDDTTETANPSGAIYGLEVDASANGTDDSNTRRGAEVVLWRSNAAGADATFAYGWRLGPSATDNGHITVKKGFSFHGSSAFQIGIDLSETTYSTAALMLGASSVVSWNSGDVTLTHSSHNLTLANGMLAIKPNANATQADSATYQLKLQDTSGTAYLTAGYDGTGGVIQSWGGSTLSLNPQGNAVKIGTGTVAATAGTSTTLSGGTLRDVLTAARTYYVRTDGSDSNTGLANTAGGAFLTIQKAVDVVAALDISIYDVTIQIAAGTYSVASTSNVLLKSPVGSGKVILVGDETTPSNVVVQTTGTMTTTDGIVFLQAQPGRFSLRGVQLKSSASGTVFGLHVAAGYLEFQNIDFNTGMLQQLRVADGGYANCTGNYTISGGATEHWTLAAEAELRVQSRTITLTGTPAFSNFLTVSMLSTALVNGNTFSGSATGTRYSASLNSVINTGGGGASYLPGDVAGSTATGGQYA